jgi:aromatic-amino-acid transaminase
VYFDDNGKLPLLKCVQGRRKADDGCAQAARLPAHRRHRRLRRRRQGLVFGADSEPVKSRPRGHRAQGIGGTGGLKIGADFLKKLSPTPRC